MACCPPLPETGLLPSDCGTEAPSGLLPDWLSPDPLAFARRKAAATFEEAADLIECTPFGHPLRAEFSVWWRTYAQKCAAGDASGTTLVALVRRFESISERAAAEFPDCNDTGAVLRAVGRDVAAVPGDLFSWLKEKLFALPWWAWVLIIAGLFTMLALAFAPAILAAVKG